MFGSIPVFVDVDPRTFCIDPMAVRKAVTPRTRAILVVHLLGNAADMDAIIAIAKEHSLVIVEDSAQSPGVRYCDRFVGTLGDLGIFSFQETKNIMTGEGGMILTDNVEYARKCRLIRNHGETVADDSYPRSDLIVGYNFRMTEITAAIGIEQLKKLEVNNAVRNANAGYLRQHLSNYPGLSMPYVPPEADYKCHVFALCYDAEQVGVPRSVFVKAIRDEGIPIGTGYPRLMYENPIFLQKSAFGDTGYPFSGAAYDGEVNYCHGLCPEAEDLIYKKFLWIYQIGRPVTLDDMSDIVRAFEKVYANLEALRTLRPEDVVLEYNR
jgi:dTDP-4-amino-4,6-dideoxygalactose transaminase